MDVKVKKLPKSEVELTITVPYETYRRWEEKAFEALGKEVKVDGFRQGSIPEDVIRKHVKPEGIKQATLDFVLPQTYSAAVKEKEVQVIDQPKIDIVKDVEKEGDDFVYKATAPVMPEITVGNYSKIKVKKEEAKVEKESVDNTIKMIMERQAEWKDVDRKVENGDRAEVDFEGFDKEGKPLPNTASKNHPVIIGSKSMVPGFEDGIKGMAKDEEKEIEVSFPKDYHSAPMQGKKVKFKIKCNRVEEKAEQKLDDAMVEKITGQKQSVDEFKKLVENDLKVEIERKNQQEHENKVVMEIIKITKAELPEAMIDREVEGMLEEQKARVKQQGLEWDQYLTHIKKSEEDFMKEHRKTAEDRILARLGVQHILKDAKIETSDEEVNAKIDEMAANYPEDQKKMALDHYKNDQKAFQYLKNNIAADKLFAMLTK